jgi:hypothetical protein
LAERPEYVEPELDGERMLYDSRRCWLDELAAYRSATGQDGNA